MTATNLMFGFPIFSPIICIFTYLLEFISFLSWLIMPKQIAFVQFIGIDSHLSTMDPRMSTEL